MFPTRSVGSRREQWNRLRNQVGAGKKEYREKTSPEHHCRAHFRLIGLRAGPRQSSSSISYRDGFELSPGTHPTNTGVPKARPSGNTEMRFRFHDVKSARLESDNFCARREPSFGSVRSVGPVRTSLDRGIVMLAGAKAALAGSHNSAFRSNVRPSHTCAPSRVLSRVRWTPSQALDSCDPQTHPRRLKRCPLSPPSHACDVARHHHESLTHRGVATECTRVALMRLPFAHRRLASEGKPLRMTARAR